MNQWIWQSKNYPNFVYDEKNLQPLLDDIHQKNKKLNSIITAEKCRSSKVALSK